MAAPTIYTDVADGEALDGKLFAGRKFWVAQHVPFRKTLLEEIKSNGGNIVELEKLADWTIADHFRKVCPPGSTSYEFISKSIKAGKLLDPLDFPAGPVRGSAASFSSRPNKTTRAAFTSDEDRLLYKYVKKKEAQGGLTAGNVIFKELETQFPRHSWQSWRDRYIKKLRDQPPPASEPPKSTPSESGDQSVNDTSTTEPSIAAKAPVPKVKPESSKAASKPKDYTAAELKKLFVLDNYEELYAFAEYIEGSKEDLDAWAGWAKSQGKQTAEQWRQYYEKVVRPVWLEDPAWKREQIREKVERQKPAAEETGDEEEEDATTLVETTTKVEEAAAVEEALVQPPVAANNKHTNGTAQNLDTRIASSSAALHESPKFVKALYENTRKRIHEIGEKTAKKSAEEPRPNKRRKNSIPLPPVPIGIKAEPFEISSAMGSSSSSGDEESSKEPHYSHTSDSVQAELQLQEDIQHSRDVLDSSGAEDDVAESTESDAEDDLAESTESDAEDDVAESTESDAEDDVAESIESDALLPHNDDEASLPSNSPTPRANRTNRSPPPPHPSSQDPLIHIESDASAETTQSLQEFRAHTAQDQDSFPTLLDHMPRPQSPTSPIHSTASSTDLGDPDPPLEASELDEFYAEMAGQGHGVDVVTRALRRTRLRPELAAQVLEAWGEGEALPNTRGVWSEGEDEAVESGDGHVLAMLERKHGLDGWGGVTERIAFLQSWKHG